MNGRFHLRWLRVALLAAGLASSSFAQTTGPAPLSLTQLTRKAGFVFSGRVLRVDRPPASPGRVPVVLVFLRVERGLRGALSGQTFTLTQWAGAWENGAQYRPGQRLFLFLYPRSPAGLTSVVGGRLGQFQVDAAGNIVLRGDQQRLLLSPDEERSPRVRTRPSTKLRYREFAGRVRRALEE